MTRRKKLVCGDCGGEVRSELVHYPRQDRPGFDLVEHWWCVDEVAAIKAAAARTNPTHRVRVLVGETDVNPTAR